MGRGTRIGSSVAEQAVPPESSQNGNSFRRRSRAELVAARAAASAELIAAKEAANPKPAPEAAKPTDSVDAEDLAELLGTRPLPWKPEPVGAAKVEEVRQSTEMAMGVAVKVVSSSSPAVPHPLPFFLKFFCPPPKM
jgi:hypothetical protein